jgi:hypothetical protein
MFCNETKETIFYLFWECNTVKSLWLEMAEILKNKRNVEIPISAKHIILGSDMFDYSINLFIVLIKYHIYSCRFFGQKPCAMQCNVWCIHLKLSRTVYMLSYIPYTNIIFTILSLIYLLHLRHMVFVQKIYKSRYDT